MTTVSTILALLVLVGIGVVVIQLIGISSDVVTLFFACFVPALVLFSKRQYTLGSRPKKIRGNLHRAALRPPCDDY